MTAPGSSQSPSPSPSPSENGRPADLASSSAVYLAAAAFVIGFALTYALPLFARLPNLLYDPIGRRFFVSARGGAIPMGYYGLVLWGFAGGTIAAVVTFLAARRGRRAASARAIGLGAAWALTALALVGAWFAWNNWP